MNCPVCQKTILLKRHGNWADNFRRFNKKISDLNIRCEESVSLDNGQKFSHFYKDMYWGSNVCIMWITVYPYRIRQRPNDTLIQIYRPNTILTNGHWVHYLRPPDKLSNEEAIAYCHKLNTVEPIVYH